MQCVKFICNQGNEKFTGTAARDTGNALKILVSSVRGVAAGTPDRKPRDKIIDAGRKVVVESGKLIDEAKNALANPGDPKNQQRLAQVSVVES